MTTIDDYLASVKPEQKVEIERLMALVKQHVPDAESSISYGMPAFKYKQKPLVYFGAFKDHLSLFPTSGPTEDPAIRAQLSGYTVTKGTIQFTLEHPLSDKLVIQILDHRLQAIKNT